jgi:pantoate--beta-alanine ligase
MQIISTIAELRNRLVEEHAIAFVPTMGNLHEGHLDLVRHARQHGSCVVTSIFVNPLQFGPAEDFDQYPRTLQADCERLQELADIVFAPTANEIYPQHQTVFLDPPPIANELCGAARPGHFRGMATVVLKLLNIVNPDVALFGKKDYQQLHIIRQLVLQLNLPVRIEGCDTVRAADGLALSSRNQYLSISERNEASFLYQMLQALKSSIQLGERDFESLENKAVVTLAARGWLVDYVTVRNQSDLQLPKRQELVVLAAAKLGKTRLLDNVEVCLSE